MGLFNSIFKKIASAESSNVIETTDTIASHYLKLKETSPKLSEKEIYEEIIKFRYSISPLKNEDDYQDLLSRLRFTYTLGMLINNILIAETSVAGMNAEDVTRLMDTTGEIIQERLKKYNLE